MKKTVSAILILFFIATVTANAQVVFENTEVPKKNTENKVLGSFQVAFGFINPIEVNNYIQNEINGITGGNYITYMGSSEISVAASFNFSLEYRIKGKYQFSFPLEYTVANKNITIDRTSLQFAMNRFSIGTIGSYIIPIDHASAMYLGAGVLLHAMSFETSSGNKLGPRFELGYSSFRQKHDYEFFIYYDSSTAVVSQSNNSIGSIDFSGAYFGARIVF